MMSADFGFIAGRFFLVTFFMLCALRGISCINNQVPANTDTNTNIKKSGAL